MICICKRMGGGFGGKETQGGIPAVMAALVAQKTGRAARLIYNKDEDMCSTGKRHAYRNEWEVGFDDAGHILALPREFSFRRRRVGRSFDLAVMERTMLHAENAYFIPDIEINGRVCFTNYPPNTAFRGFGGPQGIAAIENVIHEIAQHLSACTRLERRVGNGYASDFMVPLLARPQCAFHVQRCETFTATESVT